MNSRSTDPQLVSDFVRDLLEPGISPECGALRLLAARGFLLDQGADGLTVSDNACCVDALILDELLRESQTGHVDQDAVHFVEHLAAEDLCVIFRVLGGGETQLWDHWDRWGNFRNRVHGPKVALRLLDPFVARLVKSVTAAGLGTSMSCDGHGRNTSILWFTGPYYRIWFHVILREFVRPQLRLTCSWGLPRFIERGRMDYSGYFTVRHPRGDTLALYHELQAVAALLYLHRIALRQVKQQVASRINESVRSIRDASELYALMARSSEDLWQELPRGPLTGQGVGSQPAAPRPAPACQQLALPDASGW